VEQIDIADTAHAVIAKTLRLRDTKLCMITLTLDIINDLIILIAPSEITMQHRFSI